MVRATVLGAVVGLAACGGSAPVSSPTTADPELRRGKTVYDERCQVCHGPRGTGGVGPALGNGKAVEEYPNPAEQIAVVANGLNTMQGGGEQLTADYMGAVVRYELEAVGRGRG